MRVVVLLSTALLVVAACSGETKQPVAEVTVPAGGRPSGQPKAVEAVRAAARDGFDAYATGDYGDWWDTWVRAAKKVISRPDYVEIHMLCAPVTEGVPFDITSVRLAKSGESANVRATRKLPGRVAAASYLYRYEDGEWRLAPGKKVLGEFRKGRTPKQMAAKRRAAGECG